MALNEVTNSFNKGTFIESSNVLYKDYLIEWFKTKKTSIGIQTADVYEFYLNNRVIPVLGNYPLSKLTVLNIQSFINQLHSEGLAASTIKKSFEIIRNSLEYAVDYELLSKNVSLKVKLPQDQKKEIMIWKEKELNQSLTISKSDPMYMVFYLAVTTGMRKGELLGLRWKDIDLNTGLANIGRR